MKKFLFFLFIISLFFTFDPLNLKSDEEKHTLAKNNTESLLTLKVSDLNVKEIEKLNLKIREFSSNLNGKEFIYNYKTNDKNIDIYNKLKKFLKENNLEDKLSYYEKNGFIIDKIKVLETKENIKKFLNKDYEVIKNE